MESEIWWLLFESDISRDDVYIDIRYRGIRRKYADLLIVKIFSKKTNKELFSTEFVNAPLDVGPYTGSSFIKSKMYNEWYRDRFKLIKRQLEKE